MFVVRSSNNNKENKGRNEKNFFVIKQDETIFSPFISQASIQVHRVIVCDCCRRRRLLLLIEILLHLFIFHQCWVWRRICNQGFYFRNFCHLRNIQEGIMFNCWLSGFLCNLLEQEHPHQKSIFVIMLDQVVSLFVPFFTFMSIYCSHLVILLYSRPNNDDVKVAVWAALQWARL